MRHDGFFSLNHPRSFVLAGLLLAFALPVASAVDKTGMPELSQVEQTCLPTSVADLLIWFGRHGYPKLVQGLPSETEDERDKHTVHLLMADTHARYDWGTGMSYIISGIKKYVQDAGYDCDIEYRGLGASNLDGAAAFSQDWLKENDDPNKGFILLLAYCHYDEGSGTYTSLLNTGHAVALITAEPDMLLVDDPAHRDDEPGRKILTPQVLNGGFWRSPGAVVPVSGLLLLSGSLLDAPFDSKILMIGAICITMHPHNDHPGSTSPAPAGLPDKTIAGNNGVPSQPAPSTGATSWLTWLYNLFFSK
ncbi:MAG: hypothetical protein LV479_03810 [Methylacidiphilales bacterium]|nr:hypothetical protein [Candidatus Methylacidiphilales bacterium]